MKLIYSYGLAYTGGGVGGVLIGVSCEGVQITNHSQAACCKQEIEEFVGGEWVI